VPLPRFFDRVYSAVGGHLAVSRDDLAESLREVIVGLKCGAELSQNESWIAELTANLLARLYPRIAIKAFGEQKASLRELVSKINPDIEIIDDAPAELTIGVGATKDGASLYPSAAGWVSHLDHAGPRISGIANTYSAGAAAAFAVGELFRRVFLGSKPEEDFALSLLNFDNSSGSTEELLSASLGEVLFVAVGAVGNAGLWALSRDQYRTGHLTLIDNERLELSNLQRYVLGTNKDISKPKVLIGRQILKDTKIQVKTVQSTLESFVEERGGIGTRTVCISVDNVATRRAAQALLPQLTVNGWTGDRALGASWHIFSRDVACLACLYQPHGAGLSQTEQAARALGLSPERASLLWVTRIPLSDADIATVASKLGVSKKDLQGWSGKSLGDLYTDVVCGAAPINLPVTNRVETVPLAHQSALAGILMASELVKRTNPELSSMSQAEPLISWDDVLHSPPSIWAKPRAREKGCICTDNDYQSIYAEKWASKPYPDPG
jgi:hypothetical protein